MYYNMNVTVRGIDEELFRKFKAKAVKEGEKLGDALNEAFLLWLRAKSRKKTRLTDLKPFDWGEGTERTSVEIDEIIYGGSSREERRNR